jgi:hypothetical protein
MADLDMSLVTKRKRMMDSVGHYSRPELLSLLINREPQPHERSLAATGTSPESTAPERLVASAGEASAHA